MMGVFVQVNQTNNVMSVRYPLGYLITERGCWEWVGCQGRGGYGQMNVGDRHVKAHRWMYEQAKGPIPAGLQIDHLCRNRLCVNPDHLEAVTQRENTLRGVGIIPRFLQRTHCKRGHLLGGDNIRKGRGPGVRECLQCSILSSRLRRQKYRFEKRAALAEEGRPNG